MYKSKYTGEQVDERLDKVDNMITAATTEGEEVEDFVLMASDVQQELGDSDMPISQAAVRDAINSIENMIVTTLNTPI